MTATTKAVKVTAKEALYGNYLKSVFAVMPFVFSVLIAQSIALILAQYTARYISVIFVCLSALFFVFPVFLGTVRFFRRLIFGADDTVISVFYYLSDVKQYFKSVLLQLTVLLRVLLPIVAVTLPYIAARVFSDKSIYETFGMRIPEFVSSLEFISDLLLIGAVIAAFFILIRYYLAAFLLVSDDGISTREAVYMARVISSRTTGDFLVLILSMLHYIAATAILLLAPVALPVLLCAYCVHCRFAVTQYNLKVKEINEPDVPTFVEGE